MGICYGKEVEEEMTKIIKDRIEKAGGRMALSEQMALELEIISEIADGRYYRISPKTFEHTFDCVLESYHGRKKAKQQTEMVDTKDLPEIDIEIRCPGFDEMKRLLEMTGRRVRIVHAG